MLIEEAEPGGTKLTRYGIGARGIEVITSGGVNSYPLYNAHGNMVATLTRGVNGEFAFAGERSFAAWGVVRAGAPSGAPSQRYCASREHVQDDETGLVCVRARYCEQDSGRFISEGPGGDGANWFAYCGGNPVGRVSCGMMMAVSFATFVRQIALAKLEVVAGG